MDELYSTFHVSPVHEIAAGHRSLSGMISCVTDRIRFLPVTMKGFMKGCATSFGMPQKLPSAHCDRYKLRLTDTMSGTSQILISGTDVEYLFFDI